jgi:predicted nucleic acid-binding protein
MSNTKVVVDASVWVSRLIPQAVHHSASSGWIERYITTGNLLVAPALLLVEVAASVSRQRGQSALARSIVEDLSDTDELQLVPLDATLLQEAVNTAIDLQLRAGDAFYVAVAHQLGIPLVSWDREQLARASTIITTYSPITYPF